MKNGKGKVTGKLYGGCLDTIDALLDFIGRGVSKLLKNMKTLVLKNGKKKFYL